MKNKVALPFFAKVIAFLVLVGLACNQPASLTAAPQTLTPTIMVVAQPTWVPAVTVLPPPSTAIPNQWTADFSFEKGNDGYHIVITNFYGKFLPLGEIPMGQLVEAEMMDGRITSHHFTINKGDVLHVYTLLKSGPLSFYIYSPTTGQKQRWVIVPGQTMNMSGMPIGTWELLVFGESFNYGHYQLQLDQKQDFPTPTSLPPSGEQTPLPPSNNNDSGNGF